MSEVQLKYVSAEKATHVSYGYKKGSFVIDDNTLKIMCESDYYFKNFCFVEVKTDYYVLMFDFDFHSSHTNSEQYVNNADDIVYYVIEQINKTIKKIFVKPDISFVYCDKNIDRGVHLYYPNIIVNAKIHQYIYNDVLVQLIKNDKFKLSGENWKNIFDACITKKNGLRFPYFYKDNTYYRINENKSTYDIPLTKYKKIKLCSIRSEKQNAFPKLKIVINNEPEIKVRMTKEKRLITQKYIEPQNNKIIEYVSKKELDGILSCFREEMFTKYNDWYTMGWYIFNCNNTEDGCKLFYKYSQVGKYKNVVSYDHIKQHFNKYKISNYFNPNILRYQARRENRKLFDKLELDIDYDKKEFTTIVFNNAKIINLDKNKNDSYIQNEFRLYSESDVIFFLLKSAYGTGKTTMIEHICAHYDYPRILFITHRQSLAIEFMKSFDELGFHNYLDKSNFSTKEDRLIVNIDSLYLLKEAYNFFTEKSNLKEFDLVILDECESLLKHFESSLMNNSKDYIYSIFHDLIGNTKKVICFDGDISNRSYQYFKRFESNIKIYENMYIPRKYNFVIGYDESIYIKNLKRDLDKGLNCAVISMSAGFCEKVNKLLGKDYETLMIIGKSDDELKKKMMDSEKLLKKIQLFIYSPCITVGVDISFKHFDNLYGFVCNQSVTARDFMQMLARIRNPTSDTINLLIDGKISRSKIANYYEFDEIKLIYAHKYNYNPNDLTTYQLLRLWNKFEDLNNQLYIFPILLHLIKQKGHSYVIKDERSLKILEKLTADDIINADNINDNEYELLLEKQKDGEITQKERICIEKYLYGKVFKVDLDDIDEFFMKIHYGKLNVVKNNKEFIKYLKDGKNDDVDDENVFDNQNKYQKMEYIKNIINKLGFKNVNNDVIKSKFDKNLPKMIEVIDEKFRLMFNMKKEECDKLSNKYDTNKKIIGFVNSLLKEYGLIVKAVYKKVYNVNTKGKTNKLVSYMLSKIKILN